LKLPLARSFPESFPTQRSGRLGVPAQTTRSRPPSAAQAANIVGQPGGFTDQLVASGEVCAQVATLVGIQVRVVLE
jgi:hypothetical protein